jgi:hypothetical protein
MGKFIGRVYHPHGKGTEKQTFEGFSWPCLFFGFFWFAVKELWVWCIVSAALTYLTMGLSWLIFPFFANSLHLKHLIKKGYRFL